MFRTSLVALAVAIALAAASIALGQGARTPSLKGTVGPSFTITLKKAGKMVKRLKPGKYMFKISDKSDFHSFVLEKEKGGKFEKQLTSVSFVGKKSMRIRLTKGKWKYYCKPHESQMHHFFTVR
jgi:plastocyanin